MKDEIIQKCLLEFHKRGIRKMTLKEIVAPLGISTKTIYKYFDNKEDLLEACLNLHYKQAHEALQQLLGDNKSPVVLLFKIWINAAKLDFGTSHIFYEDLNYYYPALQDKILKKYGKKLLQPFTEVLEEGVRQGFLRKELSIPLVLQGTGAVYTMLTRTRQFEKHKLDAFTVAENIMGVYLRGLCTEKGLQEIDAHSSQTSFIQHK